MRATWFLLVVGSSACANPAVEVPARAAARTDVVLQWNEQVVATGGPQLQRTLAMVHIAVFDAVNAIEPRYRPYLGLAAPPAGASIDAAAAGAAHGVLTRLFPDQRQPLAAALARSLAAVPDGPIEDASVQYGDAAAQAIYNARLDDRILQPDTAIPPRAVPGAYELTAEYEQSINTGAREWVPFALASASQFRPGGPPALTSREYARELAEVRDIGRLAGSRHSPDEEQTARWHLEQAYVQVNRVARTEAATDGRDVLDHARLFALLNVAIADAFTGAFDAKYTYGFWRPVTAIRRADEDGNNGTEPDVVWSPLRPTPPDPEYPSAYAAVQFAGARILTAYFGPSYAFETISRGVPGASRHYDNFEAFAKEGGESGILAGVHFRTSVNDGRTMGERIADWVLEHCLANNVRGDGPFRPRPDCGARGAAMPSPFSSRASPSRATR